MKQFSDKTKREIFLLLESHELDNLIYDLLDKNGYKFDKKEIELKYNFVKEGSPEYTTSKIKCDIKITKEIS